MKLFGRSAFIRSLMYKFKTIEGYTLNSLKRDLEEFFPNLKSIDWFDEDGNEGIDGQNPKWKKLKTLVLNFDNYSITENI